MRCSSLVKPAGNQLRSETLQPTVELQGGFQSTGAAAFVSVSTLEMLNKFQNTLQWSSREGEEMMSLNLKVLILVAIFKISKQTSWLYATSYCPSAFGPDLWPDSFNEKTTLPYHKGYAKQTSTLLQSAVLSVTDEIINSWSCCQDNTAWTATTS